MKDSKYGHRPNDIIHSLQGRIAHLENQINRMQNNHQLSQKGQFDMSILDFPKWGISTGGIFGTYSTARMTLEFEDYLALRVGITRMDCPWSEIEKEEGKRDWSWTDRSVRAARALGLDIILILAYSPPWANGGFSGPTGNKYPPTVANGNREKFANFCKAAVNRYRKLGVKVFQIWNEPNLGHLDYGFWKPQADAVGYTELLNMTYLAIKSIFPGAIVISAGLAGAANNSTDREPGTFYDTMIANSALYDGIACHPYTWSTNPVEVFETFKYPSGSGSFLGNSNSLRSKMVANGEAHKKIWITEINHQNDAERPTQIPIIMDQLLTYNYVASVCWYTWFDPVDTRTFVNSSFVRNASWAALRNKIELLYKYT